MERRELLVIVAAAHVAQQARKPTAKQLEAVGRFVTHVTPAVVLELLRELAAAESSADRTP